jgi:FtsH-binding integral membrane protein
MGVIGRLLFFALIGLVVLGLLQLFVPALQTQSGELIISGLGIAVFAVFLAFDLQRVQAMGRLGANPFLMALSLYLDIFNVFLYILRFMTALSGNRR